MDEPVNVDDPFVELINLESKEVDEFSYDGSVEKAASTLNPNKDDNRRLFQVRSTNLTWDSSIPYEEQPNRLQENGPIPLIFPDHFLEVQGGIVVIYWEKDRSLGCIASISAVDEIRSTFTYRVFGWGGKSKRTYFDTGKDLEATESKVWRLVHRTEFEAERKPESIRKGQILRVTLKENITDFTGFVTSVDQGRIIMTHTTGYKKGEECTFETKHVDAVVEILSCPLFYRFRRMAAGKTIKGKNISWVQGGSSEIKPREPRKPKMLFHAPSAYVHKRTWHFFKLFDKTQFEYCTRVALSESYDDPRICQFDAVAFLAAWLTSRRLRLGPQTAYRRNLP